jgi:hypothetical protein
MFDICNGQVVPSHSGLNRRNFLRVGALGLGGLTLADWLALKAKGAVAEGRAKTKSVIQFFLNGGGPPQTDTFDPKPNAGEDITGPWKETVKTNVPGTLFNAMVPLLAQQADKFSVLRTLTHNNSGHGGAANIMMTCTYPSSLVYPDIGAIAARHKADTGYQGAIPPYVSIGDPTGTPGGGFLGKRWSPFRQGPTMPPKNPGAKTPATTLDQRYQDRRSLVASLDALNRDMDKTGAWEDMDSCQQNAYSLVLGDAKKAFDLSEEKEEVRERYGVGKPRSTGEWLLLARRLVEYGVPFITVCSGFWDASHTENFKVMKDALPALDVSLSALFEDLAQRGLLDTTMVTLTGEFGRTPHIDWKPPANGGRHHWPQCFSGLVAGGGFKGGQVVGESDSKGQYVRNRPIYPWDLSASMYKLLGIDPMGRLPHPQGCGEAFVTPLGAGKLPSGGILREVM